MGRGPRNETSKPYSNRVKPELLSVLQDLAIEHFEDIVQEAQDLYGVKLDPKDPKFLAKMSQRDRALYAKLQLIKALSQHISGAVHPLKSNTTAEKELASDIVAKTRARLAKRLDKQGDDFYDKHNMDRPNGEVG